MTGNDWRYPAFIAAVSVDSVGQNRERWLKVIRSAIVGASITELRECAGGKSIVHSLLG